MAAIAQGGSDLIGTSLQASRINLRGGTPLARFYPGTTPIVCNRTPRIEIGSRGSRDERLAGKDLGWIHGADSAGWRYGPFASPYKYQATLQSYASHISGGNDRRRTVLMIREHEIGSDQTPFEAPGQAQIQTAAGHEADFVIISEDFGRQAVLAPESF